jgi:hypothetical protein
LVLDSAGFPAAPFALAAILFDRYFMLAAISYATNRQGALIVAFRMVRCLCFTHGQIS